MRANPVSRVWAQVNSEGGIALQCHDSGCCLCRQDCHLAVQPTVLQLPASSASTLPPGTFAASLPDEVLLRALIFFYGMPLVGLLLALCVATYVWQDAGVALQLLAATSGTILGYSCAWLGSRTVFDRLSLVQLKPLDKMQ